ncbi:Abd1 SAM-dependent-RNA (guanine-N7-)-methyltransferase [Scheffersomyces amazonensis]|uniref:Abd1 SAM-dependent-RNA (guanine-N7-)-methyltransferase n=1 Tax=Scheffersomyces amazonensis TaxID=1078765 RepID=UPI00315DABA4
MSQHESSVEEPSGSGQPSGSLESLGRKRRLEERDVPAVSSSYSSAKEVPGWLKVARPQDKYEQYGQRRVERSNDTAGDSRYSKYNISTSNSVLKRRHEESSSGDDAHPKYAKYRDESLDRVQSSSSSSSVPEVTAYSNIEIANPSANHREIRYQTFESHIRDRETADINNIVRSHYNQRTVHSKYQGSRTKSPIYKLRNFNNTIKYMLLGNFVKRDENNNEKLFTLLDLCCGKGGDLNKCEFVGIEQYIGIDISDRSVEEAFSRYRQKKARFKSAHRKDNTKYNFEACFATGDCFGQTIPEILEPNFPGIIDRTFPVDCVSIQFSLHYSFETEEKVRTLIMNISKSLRPGGTFIGTIPSSDFIRGKIQRKEYIKEETGKKKFGNSIYSVTFEKDPPADGVFRPPFGNKYVYNLIDAVDNVPEYVVPFETLRSISEDYGLELKYKKNFIDIFNEEIPKYFPKLNKNLIEGMKRSDGKYGAEGDEKEAVGFYLGFVFEKSGV